MRITIELLDHLDACYEQKRRFQELFPNGVNVTPEIARAHADAGFDIPWAVGAMFTDEGRKIWNRRLIGVSRFLESLDTYLYTGSGSPFSPDERDTVMRELRRAYTRQLSIEFGALADRYTKESVASFTPDKAGEPCPACGVVH